MAVRRFEPCIKSAELRGSSLVSKFLELQTCCEPDPKKDFMIRNLFCLRIPEREQCRHLHKEPVDTRINKEFVAVSYTWHATPWLEKEHSGTYTIIEYHNKEPRPRPSKVRDVVLDRIINYAAAKGLDQVWIDRECIGQSESDVKQQALNSMDLVYQRSNHPVGLLTITLDFQRDIDTLQSLAAGTLLTENIRSFPKFRDSLCKASISDCLRLLEFVSYDRWWERAWIFQEEYLSSTKMHLLIRCGPKLRVPPEFGRIPGEVCVNASRFREGTTRFLLATQRVSDQSDQRRCTQLLNTFGKYNTLYLFQEEYRQRSMTPRVITDISRRNVSEPHDRLPIAANSCDYGVRFNTKEVIRLGYGLGLCTLAMCLLNGELIRNCDRIYQRPDAMDLGQYLRHTLFDKFDSRVQDKELTYRKSYRLHSVRLSHAGIHTPGHLWTVVSKIDTSQWSESIEPDSGHDPRSSDQRGRDHLMHVLRSVKGHPPNCDLVRYLTTRLDGDDQTDSQMSDSDDQTDCQMSDSDDQTDSQMPDSDDGTDSELSPAEAHIYEMTDVVFRAIEEKEPLFLVKSLTSNCISGIFTGLQDTQSKVFTSWRYGEHADKVERRTQVSIEVEMTQAGKPLLKTLHWVNGLVIFSNKDAKEVIFRWPEVWM